MEKRSKCSELTHLILDLLSCPYVTIYDKRRFFVIYKDSKRYTNIKEDFETVDKILIFQKKYIKYWFTKWERFNLVKELEYKKSQEVYS